MFGFECNATSSLLPNTGQHCQEEFQSGYPILETDATGFVGTEPYSVQTQLPATSQLLFVGQTAQQGSATF